MSCSRKVVNTSGKVADGLFTFDTLSLSSRSAIIGKADYRLLDFALLTRLRVVVAVVFPSLFSSILDAIFKSSFGSQMVLPFLEM